MDFKLNYICRMKKLLVAISVFCIIALPTYSQEEEAPKKSTNKSKTIIVGDDDEVDSESEEENSSSFNESQNLIKLNLTPIITGAALVSYSRAFGDIFSLEASIGAAYSNSLMYLLYEDYVSSQSINDQNSFVPVRNSSGDFNYKPGFMYRLQTRFFTDADYTHEGTYYALEFTQRNVRYSFDYAISSNTGVVTGATAEYARMRSNEYKIIYGWQGTFGDSNVFWDVNTGIGLFTQQNNFIYFDGNPLTTKALTAEGEKYYGVRYSLGFSIGYGF